MALLAEYALTPDVFDTTCYSHEEVAEARLENVSDALLSEAMVRDLRDGEWSVLFLSESRPWHQRGKELLKSLKTGGRLRLANATLPQAPQTDSEWCTEALQTHELRPLNGVIVSPALVAEIGSNPLIAPISKLREADWWHNRSPTLSVPRTKTGYELCLRPLLDCANSLMIIDAHFDPSERRYEDVTAILNSLSCRSPLPLIEVHRVCYVGSGRNRTIISNSEWEIRFKDLLPSRSSGQPRIQATIFIWNDFHDRHIISDLMGINLGNSLDTSLKPNDATIWSRLGRYDRDKIQREFDPSSNQHQLRHSFTIS